MLTKITKNSPQNGSETFLQTKEISIETVKYPGGLTGGSKDLNVNQVVRNIK